MRRQLIACGLAVSALAIAGCSGGTSALDIAPSNEITSSVAQPPAPVPGVAALIAENRQDYPPAIAPAPRQASVQLAMARPQNPARIGGPKVYRPRFGDAKPVDFGRRAPHPFAVHGVDVSHWQGDIDWKALRTQGANFAFIKATEGGKHVDPRFRENWDEAGAAGVPRGAYHFFFWCRAASEQADWFIRHVPKESGSLPPVIDVEWYGNKRSCPTKPPRKTVLKKMSVFMDRLEAHYGVKPIIYTTPDFYEDNLQGQFKDHSFWLRSVAAHPVKRYPNRPFAFWQYSGTGTARKGVATQIDLNVFNGDIEGWHSWLGQRVVQ